MDRLPDRVNTQRDDALGTSDAVDLIGRLQRREVSPAELLAAAQERAAASQPAINAIAVMVDGEPGPPQPNGGPFGGIPLPIKENEDLAGYPTSWGSWAMGDRGAARSSVFVQQLAGLGFVPLAKTTMPEFGLTATTQSVRFGDTRNPWDTARSTGGSSGGAAALVAAGVVPMAHANDGGGSTRIPASACGVVGLKPSRGRLIDRPDLRAPIPLFTQGVVSRTVRDTAAFYAAIERLHPVPGLPPIGHVRTPSPRRLRVAVIAEGPTGIAPDPEVLDGLHQAAALCERLGHRVEVMADPLGPGFDRDFLRYWSLIAFSLRHFGRRMFGPGFDGSRTTAFTEGLARMAAGGTERIPPAMRRLRRLSTSGGSVPEGFDVVATPTINQVPPTLDQLAPDVPFRPHLIRLLRLVTRSPLENVTGSPAISLPLARTGSGVPVGIQFAGQVGDEAMLLALALELEEAAPWPGGPQV